MGIQESPDSASSKTLKYTRLVVTKTLNWFLYVTDSYLDRALPDDGRGYPLDTEVRAMSKPVKISEAFLEIARAEGRVMHRAIGAQVEYWAKIGRVIESSGVFGPVAVRKLLEGSGSVQDLSEADDALYTDLLTRRLEALDGSDTRLLDDLKSGGHPIASENDQGEVVVEKPLVSR